HVGVIARATLQGGGYFGGVNFTGTPRIGPPWQYQFFIRLSDSSSSYEDQIIRARRPLDANWHVYRVDANGNGITLLFDGEPLVWISDNRFLEGHATGIQSKESAPPSGCQFHVRKFRIKAL